MLKGTEKLFPCQKLKKGPWNCRKAHTPHILYIIDILNIKYSRKTV